MMLRALDLHSERYSPTGNIAGQGVLNQLGRPKIDLVSVLVRETVQNSWDARQADDVTVQFGIHGYRLDDSQERVLRDIVLAQGPRGFLDEEVPGGASVSNTPDSHDCLYGLSISDRGTVGLGGPTRADVPSGPDEPRNFVDFLRNVGQPADRLGGGTYGYGKASLYLASQSRTICVHSHCRHLGRVESRFMAAALGSQYEVTDEVGSGLYTGRHWWGRCKSGVLEPVLGDEADLLSSALGMPKIDAQELGTNILIVQPYLGGCLSEDVLQRMAQTLLWYLWPKMVPRRNGQLPMTFQLSWEGREVEVPDPVKHPVIHHFVDAFRRLQTNPEADTFLSKLIPIECLRPKRLLGSLATQVFRPATESDERAYFEGLPSEAFCHHIALMRQVELVVKYLEGPSLPAVPLQYAGVFLADADVEKLFAAAEPPTHDDWSPTLLENRTERSLVNVALVRIREQLQEMSTPRTLGDAGGVTIPLGAVADAVGELLILDEPEEEEVCPSAASSLRGSGSGGRRAVVGSRRAKRSWGPDVPFEASRDTPQLVPIGHSLQESADGRVVLIVDFNLTVVPESLSTNVYAHARVLLDETEPETEPPENAVQPSVQAWLDPDGKPCGGGHVLSVPKGGTGKWAVAFSAPEYVKLSVELSAEAVWSNATS